MLLGEGHVGQEIRLGLVQQGRQFGRLPTDLVSDLSPLDPGGRPVILGAGGSDEGGHDPAFALASVGEDVAHDDVGAAKPIGCGIPAMWRG
ncbi:hypothetical protein N825_32015 [Skermanella stibiiresistens SB22]|uniref:Uncharacterized protein n=1 Tax=Skermanella stibiiresistens SB22 TaxID=1385369 RepID=W9GU70_9PROT|nr:hypothetical protein N825_32015 [Skermanella stibiiresistens SB22]